MTEPEAREAIAKWVKYARYGEPTEPDCGDGMPAGIKAAGLESQYKSPQIWHWPELQLVATKADYDRIEVIFQSFAAPVRFLIKEWYFHGQGTHRVARDVREMFLCKVMAL